MTEQHASMPTPRYQVGSIVYQPVVGEHDTAIPCPDCNDTRRWEARSAHGLVLAVDCPRCMGMQHMRPNTPDLYRRVFMASTRQLTIGRVNVEWPSAEWRRHPASYMCVETGVGTGQNYDEPELFDSRDAAQAEAERRVNERLAKWSESTHGRRAIAFSSLNIRDAMGTGASDLVWDSAYKSSYVFRELRDLLDNDENRGDFDRADLQGILEGVQSSYMERNPLTILVHAARAFIEWENGKGGDCDLDRHIDTIRGALEAFDWLQAPVPNPDPLLLDI